MVKKIRFTFWGCRVAAALALSWLAGGAAWASRPMMTDDARITQHKACQLESWVKRNHGSVELWALPACNPFGNLEITVGGATLSTAGATHVAALQFQAKSLFKPVKPNGWGIGAAVSLVEHPRAASGREDYSVNVPASFSFANDKAVLHANVGWLRDGQARQELATWGLGSEVELPLRSWLIAESFGQHNQSANYQVGLRHWIVRDRVQMDATYGNRYGSRINGTDRWFTVGLRLLSAPILP